MTFTHLQVRSGYSFYESTMTIEKLIKQAKQLNFQAISLTDEAVLYGAIRFYQACIENGIKPILGMAINVEIEHLNQPLSCVLLAKSNKGYRNLMEISTFIQIHNSCPLRFIAEHHEDIICILSSGNTVIHALLKERKYEQLVTVVQPLKELFLPTDFYFGVEIHDEHDQANIKSTVQLLSKHTPFQLTAHHDVRFGQKKDVLSYHCLQAMGKGEKWNNSEMDSDTDLRYLRPKEEMLKVFQHVPELLEANTEIVDKCFVQFDFNQQLLPEFPTPSGETASQYLEQQCLQALKQRKLSQMERAKTRLNKELQIINQLDFSDYFLIVADYVQFAKDNGIVVGPGRGSAAGSLVAYLLGITNVDPLKYNLLFERFLNPERVSMPDIDIDFSDVRRDEVIEYIRGKYGAEHVAQIITFGTFQARSLIRELMKTMEVDFRDQAYILQHIPVQATKSIAAYIKESKDFATYIKQSESLKVLFRIAVTLEGLPRHLSTHAAGIVIAKKELLHDVPLTIGTNDTYLTQYAMYELEAIGLLKMDILGLRNLTLIERIVHSIKKGTGKVLDVDAFPEKDEVTFQLLQAGKTNGIFQFESAGMKNVLTSLKPTSLEDLIALNALYRPGPMEQIPTYVKRKHRQEKVTYLHPDLEPILASTYGVLVYQEQIMQVAHQFAGLTLGKADMLRRAISKKDYQLIDEQKEAFITGCVKKGYELEVAEEIFSWIHKFANYGFNKSHSVAYSKIAYQLSYLKAHYPTHFFAHLLSTIINDGSKLQTYVREANELGIYVYPPSINKSYPYFAVEQDAIRIGLMAIKGVGYETVQHILHARKEKPFTDLFDFCLRVREIKRNTLETLILAGVFDETYSNRASLLASIDQALARADLFGDVTNQGELFADDLNMRPAYTEIEDFSNMQKLSDEKELMQLFVSNHPLKSYRKQLGIQQFIAIDLATQIESSKKIKVAAILQDIKKIHTKRGDSMAFITITDETGEMDGVIFPDVYRNVSPLLKETSMITIQGKISTRKQKKQIIVDTINSLDLELMAEKSEGIIYIKLIKGMDEQQALYFLREIAEKYKDDTAILLYREVDKQTYKLGEKYNLSSNGRTLLLLKEYFGEENVVFSK